MRTTDVPNFVPAVVFRKNRIVIDGGSADTEKLIQVCEIGCAIPPFVYKLSRGKRHGLQQLDASMPARWSTSDIHAQLCLACSEFSCT
jgi:hypothetical protein